MARLEGRTEDRGRWRLRTSCASQSGGLSKLDIYRRLGVREVWIWRRGRLTAHSLRGDAYQEVTASEIVPGIDLDELAGLLDRPTASQAMREYRSSLESRRTSEG